MNRDDRHPDDLLDETLRSLDVLAPPARASLHDDVQRAFRERAPGQRRRISPWLPAAVCAAAAAVGWLLITLTPESGSRDQGEPAARIARRVELTGRTLRDLQMSLLGSRLEALGSRFPLPSASPADTTEDSPAPLIEGASNMPHKDQVALMRLALLEQSSVEVLGVEGLRQRLEELAGTYEGSLVARRARRWADQLNP